MLGQRHGRELLRELGNRVLLPPDLADPGPRDPRRRGVDRGPLQPPPAALLDRASHACGLRDAILVTGRRDPTRPLTRVRSPGSRPIQGSYPDPEPSLSPGSHSSRSLPPCFAGSMTSATGCQSFEPDARRQSKYFAADPRQRPSGGTPKSQTPSVR
jgi:hypothetical protein